MEPKGTLNKSEQKYDDSQKIMAPGKIGSSRHDKEAHDISTVWLSKQDMHNDTTIGQCRREISQGLDEGLQIINGY